LSESSQSVSRRKFMAATTAAVAAPLVMSMTGNATEVKAAAEQSADKLYYINDNCILCPPLPCKTGCPAEAISFDGDKFAIDNKKCIRCGNCEKVCEIGAVTNANASAIVIKPHNVLTRDCDLVVIGAGTSGLIAAGIAADLAGKGKKIILLDKAKRPGGSSFYANGFRLWSTKWQLDAGVPDQMDDYVRSAMNTTRWQLNPQLVYNAFRAVPAFFDWFCTWGKAEEIWEMTDSRTIKRRKSIDVKNWQVVKAREITHRLINHCKDLGVEILTEHAAKEYIMGDHGEIVGVKAADPGGTTIINCKYCLVSTGNLINCDALIARCAPQYVTALRRRAGHRLPTNTGDGVLMAERAGIPVDYDNICVTYTGPNASLALSHMRAYDQMGEAMHINLHGKRWVNETYLQVDTENGFLPVLLRQPKCMFYAVMDTKIMEMDPIPTANVSTTGNISGRNVEANVPDPDAKETAGGPGGPGGGGGGNWSAGNGAGPGGVQAIGGVQGPGGQAGGAQTAGAGGPGGAPAGMTAPGGGGQVAGGAVGKSGGAPSMMKEMMEWSKLNAKELEEIAALKGRHVVIGNTLEELADKMGVDRKTFVESVKRYNELCAKGRDEDYFKPKKYLYPIEKAPFYATSHFLSMDGAVGGLSLNEHMQVMGKEGPVDNLYAAGDTTSSRYISRGQERIEIVNDNTWAMASGFLAGENIGKRLKNS
jgi:succinate dehydrogenase/fumarate reductase flavoprotein subunit